VSDLVGVPAVLCNDADVAGLAEALFGAGKGMSPIFYITIGSGIGGGLIIGQVALALGIQMGINKVSASVALGMFFVYAASLGLSIGLIVSLYTDASVVTAFLSASAMFGAAAIYGHVTKRSLAKLGGLLQVRGGRWLAGVRTGVELSLPQLRARGTFARLERGPALWFLGLSFGVVFG